MLLMMLVTFSLLRQNIRLKPLKEGGVHSDPPLEGLKSTTVGEDWVVGVGGSGCIVFQVREGEMNAGGSLTFSTQSGTSAYGMVVLPTSKVRLPFSLQPLQKFPHSGSGSCLLGDSRASQVDNHS